MHFSIIIPVYNVEPDLRECLDSVLVQICGDWEAVCVDDGNVPILDYYASRDSRIADNNFPNNVFVKIIS